MKPVDPEKGIKREYSVARTPQQNGVAERRNRTLIEAAKTMLADTKLPSTFWAEAISTGLLYRADTVSNISVGTSEVNSQECIVMPIWKDTSYFDSPTENVDNGEPKTANDAQNRMKMVLNNENTDKKRRTFADSNFNNMDIGGSPYGKMTLEQKVFRNKKDKGNCDRNKARLFAQGLDNKGCKECFLYGTIEEESMFTHHQDLQDPDHLEKDDKVVKSLYGMLKHQEHGVYVLVFEKLMKDKFQMSSMGELTFFLGLQVQQKEDGIFISQDKYVAEILKKFNYSDVKSASTPVDLEKPLVKDGDADDVYVHLYRSMIGSLMYLTASRPDIMFAVCACARFQVTPKTSHLLAVKRIFRYLKGKPTLGLWYSRDSPFELVAYTDSDYAGATLDRKSTTGGSEYVAAASCCRQVLWIQNQLLDYGYNFMNTVINIDNNSTICIIENPVQHSKTKHIEIRHHFIRDCNTKELIQVVKIHTDLNVADLLTKGFNAGRFQYLVSSIGMLNP
ncbi:putative ribonuclease H-like domain-containing protein [Tanacetum coccineum]